MIVFMLCLYLFIHSNYCLSNIYGQDSPSENYAGEDLADFYGRSDEYSNEPVQRTKTKNGFRQLGLIGNLVNTQSHSDCRQILYSHHTGNEYAECMIANDKLNQQNIIKLATEVLRLRKRLTRMSRRPAKNMGYDRREYDYY